MFKHTCAFALFLAAAGVAHAAPHDADYQQPSGVISLSELLRVVQFYSVGGYGCGESEDGFIAGGGAQCDSGYHDGDYAAPFSEFSLGEVLRMIQLYNAGVYSVACEGTEDGFAPVAGPLDDCPAEGEGEAAIEGAVEAAAEGEGVVEGTVDGATEAEIEGGAEGAPEGEGAGQTEGGADGADEGEGDADGATEGTADGSEEGAVDGATEGSVDGAKEGAADGSNEGIVDGDEEGVLEGVSEGGTDGEGTLDGEGSADGEGVMDGEGFVDGEGTVDGEGVADGEGTADGEGITDGEGNAEGEGVLDGEGGIDGEGGSEGEGVVDGEGGIAPEPGPFAVGVRTQTFVDAMRSNRNIPATIYYPAVAAGNNQPIAGNEANRFPVMVFGHGFAIGISFYSYIWNGLVPAGYIVVMCNTETGTIAPPPDHAAFGRDLAFLVDAMQGQGADGGSPYFNRVAARSAVAGHSMGGGATMLSVQHSANISAIVPIAAANTNNTPNSIAVAPGINVPALVIAGEKDCVAPPGSNARAMYDGLGSDCRAYASIDSASHCQFAVNSTICNFGEIICPGQTYVGADAQRATTITLMRAWLDVHLKQEGNIADISTLLVQEDAANRVTSELDCP